MELRCPQLLSVCSVTLALFTSSASAYETPVHREITANAIGQVLNTNHFLSELGFTAETKFNGNSPDEWMRLGSVYEDNGLRPFRHFFDPISELGLGAFMSARDWALDSGANNPEFSIPE